MFRPVRREVAVQRLLLTWWRSLDSKPLLWLLLILGIGGMLRVAAFTVKDIPLPATRYQRLATHLAASGEFTYCNTYFPFCGPGNETTAAFEPLPVLVYAACLRLFGPLGIHGVVVFQLLLGLLLTGVLYGLIVCLFGDRRTALLGAFLWATYIQMIALELMLYPEAIFAAVLGLGLLALVYALRRGQVRWWLAAGLGLGLAALSRASFVYYPLVLLGVLALVPATRRLCSGRGVVMFAVAYVVVLSPWVVRNFVVFQAFVPGGTLTGYNLYRHNHFITGKHYFHYGDIEDMNAAIARLVKTRQDLRGNENEYDMDRVYRQEAVRIIQAHPVRYALLSLYRFLPLWTDYGIRDEPLSRLLRLVGLENILLLALGVAAAVRRRGGRPPELVPLLVLVVYYTLGHMLVNARIRYIVPIMPYIMVFAADQCVHIVRRFVVRLDEPSPVAV
jgi:4-amino-4-deoxy-L-arabinose transferase-like glycosyltransferase